MRAGASPFLQCAGLIDWTDGAADFLEMDDAHAGQARHLHSAAHSASKWGVIGLMKSTALELGRYGTTVNRLVPGLVDTPLTRHQSRYAKALAAAGQRPS
jgi:NAD(P)-dependent dehydrogenase (short-subunit alcohol dehydrogenase family)